MLDQPPDVFRSGQYARHEPDTGTGETLDPFPDNSGNFGQVLTTRGDNSRAVAIPRPTQKLARQLFKSFLNKMSTFRGEMTMDIMIRELRDIYHGNEWLFEFWKDQKDFNNGESWLDDTIVLSKIEALKDKIQDIKNNGWSMIQFIEHKYNYAYEKFYVNILRDSRDKLYWLLHKLYDIDNMNIAESILLRRYLTADFAKIYEDLMEEHEYYFWRRA